MHCCTPPREFSSFLPRRISRFLPNPSLARPGHDRLFPLLRAKEGTGRPDNDPHRVRDEVGDGVIRTLTEDCFVRAFIIEAAKSAFVLAMDMSRKVRKFIFGKLGPLFVLPIVFFPRTHYV